MGLVKEICEGFKRAPLDAVLLLGLPLWWAGLVGAECYLQFKQNGVQSQESAIVSYEETLPQSKYSISIESPKRLDEQSYLKYKSFEGMTNGR